MAAGMITVVFAILAKIDFDHARVALDLIHAAFRKDPALMQDGDLLRDRADEFHVVLDDHDRVAASELKQELAG